ncbi:hypothetical protein [Niallia sp. 03190]|uniref:hypothetical protein n=1 Tax=Niallia sp. 03190 TaxID=3458061 RepID=UPI00404455E8
MNQLKLNKLTLRNFKGVKVSVLDARGENVRMYGDNATGKTTHFDAPIWLLFNKDSQNKKDFQIKTLDSNNNVIHGLEHEVEGLFDYNGNQIILKKVYKEKWSKKRGQATDEFTGHTTDHYIDDVPVAKKVYDAKIAEIMEEDIFKLLTSPTYFNEQLHWQKRREILLDVCGGISDEEVIAFDKKLSRLPEILNGKTIEDYRKIIASRRSLINKELEKIPVRIDEIKRNLPTVEGIDKTALEKQIEILIIEIDELMTKINSIKNGKAVADIQKSVQEIEMELMNIKRDHDSDSKDKIYQLRSRIQEETSNIYILKSKIDNINQRKGMSENNIKELNVSLSELRQKWHEVTSKEFVHEDACNCPTCGQDLPEDQVQSARDKALASFNKNKSENLEKINVAGKTKSQKVTDIQESIAQMDKEINKISEQISEKESFVKGIQEQLKGLESSITDILENPLYVEKLQAKQKLEDEIKGIREESTQSIQTIQMEILNKKQQRDNIQSEIGQFAYLDSQNQRIQELMDEERNLAVEFEKMEEELFLTEEFIRSKVELLEEKINSKFQYANFKLFETQINGGLQEVCETTYNGVPYSSGLNNAARINVGLDIINTLSEHYNFSAPIFIDNAEAVTKLIDTKAQTIALIVSEQDKSLRVEVKEDLSLIPVNVKVV